MTLHNRYLSHRHLGARQHDIIAFFSSLSNPDPSAPIPDPVFSSLVPTPTSTQALLGPTNNGGQNNGSGQNGGQNSDSSHDSPHGHGIKSTTTSTTQLPDTTTDSSTPTPTPTHHGRPTESTEETASSTSTSTSTQKTSTTPTTTTSTTSSSSSTSTSTSTSLTSFTSPKHIPTIPVTITAPTVFSTRTTPFVVPTDDSIATPSPTSSAAPSAGLSTGAIVGSVAGGIVGLVAIFFIVAFLLRRWRRNRVHDEDFNPEEFVRSPNMSEPGNGYNNNPFEPTPPNPAFRHHSIAPSITSGPNMAGQGTYAYGNDTPYSNAAYAAGGAVVGAAAYGMYEAHTNDDATNGVYSSEPRPQQAYNAEAYGSYAYSTDGPHAVTTGTQHAHPYSSAEYQAHYQDNVPTPAPARAPAPALVAGAPAVPANRAPSVYNVEDAYGGI
ncbi:hypothetical protein H2248_010974 [Termitomyces sp. 'cryptogamus']|nr:hypothetical protein H2248_010974 [Termitomyces sp. 'cryptogamus']